MVRTVYGNSEFFRVGVGVHQHSDLSPLRMEAGIGKERIEGDFYLRSS